MKRDPGIDVCTIWIYLILWTVQLNVVKMVIDLLRAIYHTHKNPTLPMGLSAVYTLTVGHSEIPKAKQPIFSGSLLGWRPGKKVCIYTCLAIVAGVVINPMTYYEIPVLPSAVVNFQRCRKRRRSSALEPQTQEAERNNSLLFSSGPGILCLI